MPIGKAEQHYPTSLALLGLHDLGKDPCSDCNNALADRCLDIQYDYRGA